MEELESELTDMLADFTEQIKKVMDKQRIELQYLKCPKCKEIVKGVPSKFKSLSQKEVNNL